MRNTHLAFLLLLAALVVTGAVLAMPIARSFADAESAAFHGTPYAPVELAPDFELTNETGNRASLADYRGNAVLLFFGFTNCPDVCPITLAKLSRITDSLEEEEDVQILLVSVDPERDIPPVLAEYTERFGPRVEGLTGESETLREMRAAYGVYAAPVEPVGATHAGDGHPAAQPTSSSEIGHTDAVFGIDRKGYLRVLIHPGDPADQIRDDIRALLAS